MVGFWGFGEGALPGQQTATFLIRPHMAFPGLCMRKERQRERRKTGERNGGEGGEGERKLFFLFL